jgi:IS5 family transposase
VGDQIWTGENSRINWEGFRPKLEVLFNNNTERGGRPNIDVVVMLKSLFIQQLYCLSDEQLERELADRISFRMFLGTTEIVPDSTTIWKFRELLAESGKDKDVWDELQR